MASTEKEILSFIEFHRWVWPMTSSRLEYTLHTVVSYRKIAAGLKERRQYKIYPNRLAIAESSTFQITVVPGLDFRNIDQ